MTLRPEGLGLHLCVVSIALLALSWITVTARMYIRHSIKALGSDDWNMLAGLVFYTLACQATISGSFNGVGAHGDRITDYYDREGRKWFMFFQLFYVASTVPIKCSICIALLRINTRQVYKYILFGIMILSTIAAITTNVAVLAWCRPVSATWDKRTGSCGDPSLITNVSYFISASSITTDWLCAIMPALILWDVQLRFRIKASVGVILALGVVASTATLVRLKYILNYNNPNDYLNGIANIAIWSIVESGIGLIAGSMPALRPLLRHIAFFGSSSYVVSSSGRGKGTRDRKSHKLVTLRGLGTNNGTTTVEAGRRSWEEISDAESQKGILDINNITVKTDFVVTRENGTKSVISSISTK
ncbi:hypothetical protein GGR57DRAFT_511177 [Xylariaceae sp. FL1272]|nr:hypothetical protein GGR57DRAFT_511177 [Xylariaceae sp. FL1272]